MVIEESGGADRISLIDRFLHWVESLRIRPWVFYGMLGIVLICLQLFFLYLDSGFLAAELLPVIVFNGLAIPYLLATIQFLDRQALHALEGLKPVLTMSREQLGVYQSRIANMPFFAPLLAGLALTVFTIFFPMIASEPQRYAALEELSLFTVIYHIVDKCSAFLFGVLIFHTIRQLRLVYEISSNFLRINIFQIRPVQAFSGLTATTSLCLALFFYGWIIINPELLADPAVLAVSLLFGALVVLVFAWPLWGLHKLMAAEQMRALQEIELKFEELFAKFNQSLTEENYAAADKLNGMIMSLEIQHNKVSAVPTWPWRPETARIVLTAVALPVLLIFVQFLLQQALGR
ncbi:MAG: hypothetical protein ACK2UK_03375 [Candidatus Promineifilaceae bacterium]